MVGTTSYPPEVRKIVDVGLDLARKNLRYQYPSADSAKGGMDCSGFIYYVLTKAGINNVPRDAREQYVWLRKAGNFQAVLAQRDDTFELDSLKPGDLLFWATNFGVSREPEITQTMIYVGRDRANQRLMIGASERGTFKGRKEIRSRHFRFYCWPRCIQGEQRIGSRLCWLRSRSGSGRRVIQRESSASDSVSGRIVGDAVGDDVDLSRGDWGFVCRKCCVNAVATSTTTKKMTTCCSRFVSWRIFRISSRIESDL